MALPGSVIVDSLPKTSPLPPMRVPPAPAMPAETTATTPVPTSRSSSRQSGLCPAANSSGYQSQPMDRFTPWMTSWRPSALNARTQARHRRVGDGAPGEVRMGLVDAGVNDRPDDAVPRGAVGAGRGVGLDGGQRAVDVGMHDEVGPDPVDGVAGRRRASRGTRVLRG